MDANRSRVITVAVCCALLVAALLTTLANTSAFAAMFEPAVWLAWAWAIYVDLALAGYTVAYVWLRQRDQRTGVVRFGFYWFVGLSLLANVIVVLARYDARRGAGLIDGFLAGELFLFVASIGYGASIPLSVLTFAHTIAEAVGKRERATAAAPAGVEAHPSDAPIRYESNNIKIAPITPPGTVALDPNVPQLNGRRLIQFRVLHRLYHETENAPLSAVQSALGLGRSQASKVRQLAVDAGFLVQTDAGYAPRIRVQTDPDFAPNGWK